MKILITGFDPFGGESVNPACEAVKLQAVGKPLGTPSMDLHQIARGILQPNFAQELVDALWLKYSEWVWTISANTADYFAGYNQFQNLTVGGKTRSGVLYRICWFI